MRDSRSTIITDVDEELNYHNNQPEKLKERLGQYIIFFANLNCIDSEWYCFDKSSFNEESKEMNIEQFHQDTWYYLATLPIEKVEETRIFDKFIVEYIEEKIEEIKEEFE